MRTLALMALVLMLTCAGCADEPRPEEAEISVESSRTRVQAAAKAVAELLRSSGHEINEATGKWRVCSAEPVASLQYSVGGLVDSPRAASVSEALASISEVLQGSGWVVETEGTDPEPYANLHKDGLRVALGESRRERGSVALGLKDECIDTTPGQDSLLGEQDRVLG